jgi:uncharacterized protein DUF6272
MKDLYKLLKEHEKNRLITSDRGNLSFAGLVTTDVLHAVNRVLELKFDTEWDDSPKKKRSISVSTEVFQNVYHQMTAFNTDNVEGLDLKNALLVIERAPDDLFYIYTGNFIHKTDLEKIKNKIDHVNEMDDDALKEYYKIKLSESELSEKGGAGLGIIDIAKKSKNKIDYKFDLLTDDYVFFSLCVTV